MRSLKWVKNKVGTLPKLEKGQTYGEILEEGPIYVQDSSVMVVLKYWFKEGWRKIS